MISSARPSTRSSSSALCAEILERQHGDDGLTGRIDARQADGNQSGDTRKHRGWGRRPSGLPATRFPGDGHHEKDRRCYSRRIQQPHGSRMRFQRRQIRKQRIDTLITPLGRRIDRTLDDPGELRRNAWPRGPDVRSLATLMGKAQIAQTVRSHRVRSGQEMVEKHAEAVDIAADGGFLPRTGARAPGRAACRRDQRRNCRPARVPCRSPSGRGALRLPTSRYGI